MSDDFFSNRVSVQQVEESNELAPKFDNEGLIPVITMDSKTSDILMLGYQNAEALSLSIKTGFAHYWSRSRKCLWKKGDTSGLYQRIDEIFNNKKYKKRFFLHYGDLKDTNSINSIIKK